MEFHPSVGNLGQYDTDNELMMYETMNGAFIRDTEVPVVSYTDPYINTLSAEFQESHTILTDAIHQYGITTLAFDPHEELLWMGNQGGYVASYYGAGMQRYTAFKVHETEEVRCIQPLDECILALTSTSLRSQLRRGVPLFTHVSDNMAEMQCLLPLQNDPDCILMGGHQPNLIHYNINRQQEINLINAGSDTGCVMLRQGNTRFVFCGDPSGVITLRDPISLNIEHSLNTHTASLSDFDVHGNLLVTCGFSTNRQGSITVDRLLMVYDIRMMRAVSPIDVMLEPFLLRFMPSMSPRVAVASSLGQLQLVDTVTLTEPNLSIYQVIIVLDISRSVCECFLSIVCRNILFYFSRFCVYFLSIMPVECCESVERNLYKRFHLRKTPPIDPEILNTMKMQGTIGYAPNPNTRRRNQVDYMIHFKNGANKNSNQTALSKDKLLTDDIHGNGIIATNNGSNSQTGFVAIPKRYRKIETKFTKLGSEDFDFEQYNKTIFSGLEATLPNSYCNAMIQVLFFIEPLRKTVLSHLCNTEFCLCCELSFLFHMLSVAKSLPCHSGNFLRALRNAHEASALGLILPDQNNTELRKKTNLIYLIQNWNRFILHQIHCELLESKRRSCKEAEKIKQQQAPPEKPDFVFRDTDFPTIDLKSRLAKCREKNKTEDTDEKGTNVGPSSDEPSSTAALPSNEETEVSRLFGSKQVHINRCLKCKREMSKESSLLVCNLVYPERNDACIRLTETPPVRELTTSNHLYYTNSWLPLHVLITLQSSGEVNISKVDKTPIDEVAAQIKEENNQDKKLYDLSAVVCYVHEEKKNLVSIINVPASYHKNPSLPNSPQWYIFNDICISQVTGQEAIWFSLDWKIPCVLYYTEHSLMTSPLTTEFPPEPISRGVFSEDVSLAENNRGCRAITFTPLTLDETPQPGELVAMDAEFVTLNQEESEIRSGGKLSTVKPSHYSVARITCVRGQGPLEGTPFIDDYIATQEQVVDYLTKFSGIKPGDLDVSCSSKHLTTLKSTYLKLRFLIDNGVKFVGHGLSNDFRVINLMVPLEQIIDTVQLFYLPGQRMVSLRFLAWHYLGMKIQSQTHDSIEDAKSALELYKVYLKLQKEGSFASSLEELYEIGKSVQWKVPGVDN
ncbi:PAN2-PAN3 deadenylation complex catalytic subunit PAN2 [Diaphorina citri]|uniref:PAN2-PAN3 deadenylation complex catalytic subunit PAN2 n=1 Tax=Diaphorina citri TaxID=121845 RepID=A0A3Q0IPN6_DIACI|nr:PAN2-PAN3 deadenylation complex catalytic subunit PAN2 [Diaphorina citri]